MITYAVTIGIFLIVTYFESIIALSNSAKVR
jgi:hypothetical protein